MSRHRLRLHHRIVIPFVIVAFVITTALAAVAVTLIRRALEARAITQLHNTSAVVSRTDFALNPAILKTVKEITGADVVTFTDAGAVVSSTTDAATAHAIVAPTQDASLITDALTRGDAPVLHTADCSGVPCYVAYSRTPARPNTLVAVVIRTAEVRTVTAAIARALVGSAALALVVMVLVSQVVARRVTAPLDQLVAFARSVEPVASRQRALVSNDEIGTLAAAFNDMLDRLDRAQASLVRSEKLAVTGLLAARVAHDIRNPLSSIKMQTQLLRARAPNPEDRPLIDAVLHDVNQVESVIRGLLELARPSDLKLTRARLNDIVAQLLEHLAPQLTHRRVTVVTDFDGTLASGPLDVDKFEQAVLNVLLNAADAMPFGGTMAVTTRAVDAGGSALLEIADDGVGVDPVIIDRVFDPFVSTKREGIGLGLVNTKAVVENHGGTVDIAPRQPKGTVVRIRIPLVPLPIAGGSPTAHA
jgi:signal transduction histidine kinase